MDRHEDVIILMDVGRKVFLSSEIIGEFRHNQHAIVL